MSRAEPAGILVLGVHGDDDRVVPFAVGGQASAVRLSHASLKVCARAPHGITDTHRDQLGTDLPGSTTTRARTTTSLRPRGRRPEPGRRPVRMRDPRRRS